MRILFLVDHAVAVSGPHRNVVGTLNAFALRKDLKVTLYTSKIDDSEPYAKSSSIEVKLGYLPLFSRSLGSIYRTLTMIRSLAKKVDLIYVPSGLRSLIWARLASIGLGKPIVAGPNVTHLPIRQADSPGALELMMMADVWLEASTARLQHVRSCLSPKLALRVHAIPHAIDHVKFSPERRDLGIWSKYKIRPDTLKLIYVGRDNEEIKGVSRLLDAIKELRGEFEGRIDFILVGQMSEATVMRAQPWKDVHLLGFRSGEELSTLYASSDLSVVPSSWENMPFTILEALASGLAVVASKTGGIPEMIVDGESGILVESVGEDGRHLSDAAPKFAAAIRALLLDDKKRYAIQRQARLRALAEYSETSLGSRLLGLFEKVLENH